MTPNDIIAKALANSQALLHRYVADLTPQEYLHRPTAKANCAAWTIGHLALTDRRCLANTFGVGDLPPLPEGFEKTFSRDEGCPEAASFGDVSMLMPLFDQHRNRLIDAVKRAAPEQIAKPLEKPHPMFANAGEQALFMAIHTSMHAGQITIIRRSLGRPPLV